VALATVPRTATARAIPSVIVFFLLAIVNVAERALMERREEIKTICCWPRRPKGHSDAHWVRAAVACRLGYNLWREG
jgi:hypothetical protein